MAHREHVIGSSGDVGECSTGLRFALDERTNGFAIRFAGKVSAFVNRCPHLGTELDWQPGEFYEEGGLYLVCSTHGALFEPGSGYCVAGPCRGASLERLQVRERDGRLFLEEEGAPSNDKETNP